MQEPSKRQFRINSPHPSQSLNRLNSHALTVVTEVGKEPTWQASLCRYGRSNGSKVDHDSSVVSAVPEIDFGVASNATYTREDFGQVPSCIAFDDEFANAGAKAYQLARGDDVDLDATARNPLARALLYNLRAFDADCIDGQIDAFREAVLTHAAHERVFQKPIDVAIDVHDWLFYGGEETPKVANTNPEQRTNLAYKFATICIVSPNVRFTLDWTSLDDGSTDELAAAVRQLASTSRKHVRINRVYCDHEFYCGHIVKTFKDLSIELVMRASKS